MGKIKITWQQLEEILKNRKIIGRDEEVKELTLTKPRTLLIHAEIVRGEEK